MGAFQFLLIPAVVLFVPLVGRLLGTLVVQKRSP